MSRMDVVGLPRIPFEKEGVRPACTVHFVIMTTPG